MKGDGHILTENIDLGDMKTLSDSFYFNLACMEEKDFADLDMMLS